MIDVLIAFAVLAFLVAAVWLGRTSARWRRLAWAVLAAQLVLTVFGELLDRAPEPSPPATVLVPAGDKPQPEDLQGYIVRVLAFWNGDFERPCRWVERVVTPGKAEEVTLDLGAPVKVRFTFHKPDAGHHFDPARRVRCELEVHRRLPTYVTQEIPEPDYESLDGLVPGATALARIEDTQVWGSLLRRSAEFTLQLVPIPIGKGGARGLETGPWMAAHGAALAARCRAQAAEPPWQSLGDVESPLASGLCRLSIWAIFSVVSILVIANGRMYQLRALSLLSLAWIALVLLTIRGIEALHVSRLASPDPEVRRRAVHYILNATRSGTGSSVEAAAERLWDAEPRVVYEVLRAGDFGLYRLRKEQMQRLEELSGGTDAAIAERASYLAGTRKMKESAREQMCAP